MAVRLAGLRPAAQLIITGNKDRLYRRQPSRRPDKVSDGKKIHRKRSCPLRRPAHPRRTDHEFEG